MPTVRRRRTIESAREAVWDLVSDPFNLPRWWPGVQRVEEASEEAWTKVLTTPKGRPVRADFTRVSAEAPSRLVWRQEIDETPFERFLGEAVTEIRLEEAGSGATEVEISAHVRLRGFFTRLGSFMVRRATGRQLDEALSGLERTAPTPARGPA